MKERLQRLAWLGVCALGTLVNPFGFKIYKMMWDDFFLSSQFIMGWDKSYWPGLELFWVCVGLLWLLLLVHFVVNRKFAWDQWGAAFFLTLISTRHNFGVPLFMIFAAPILIQLIYDLIPRERWTAYFPDSLQRGLLGVGIFLFLFVSSRTRVSGGFDQSQIPTGAFDLIENGRLTGPFYNDYGFGGYWMWRFAGQPPVFIDGRYPAVEGYVPLLNEIYQAKYNKPAVWTQFLNRYTIQGALVKYLRGSPYPSLYEVFFPRNEWALVYWDDAGLLFLKRNVLAHKDVIAAWEFKEILPDATPAYFLHRYKTGSPERRKLIERELKTNKTLHPNSQLTQTFIDLVGSLPPLQQNELQ